MTTEPPIIQRADLQTEWIKRNPKPPSRAPLSEVLEWAKRWRASDEYAECCAITEHLIESQP